MRRLLVAGIAAPLVATALIGVLHLPAAKPLLAAMAGCPVPWGAVAVSPEQAAVDRRAASSILRGQGQMQAVQAFGLELGVATAVDVQRWAQQRGGACLLEGGGTGLSCGQVRFEAGTHGSLFAELDLQGRVVALSSMERSESPSVAVASFVEVKRQLEATAGAPSRESGVPDAAWLGGGALRQARAEFRRENAYAGVSATHLSESEFVVSRVVRWLGEG